MDTPKIIALNTIKLLNSYSLISAFTNVCTAYKYACTIPTSLAFTRKSIKTRLRSVMKNNLLGPLIM